jgi:adenylosuccinate synthase
MTTYEELPIELKEYIEFIEKKFLKIVSVGRQKTNYQIRLKNSEISGRFLMQY